MLIQISVVAAVVMFFILAGYGVWTMQVAVRSMRKTTEAVGELQKQLQEIGKESLRLIESMNMTVEELQDQLQSTASLAASARQVGETVRCAAASVSQVTRTLTETAVRRMEQSEEGHENRFNQWLDWTGFGLGLWHQWHHHQTNAKGERKQ